MTFFEKELHRLFDDSERISADAVRSRSHEIRKRKRGVALCGGCTRKYGRKEKLCELQIKI